MSTSGNACGVLALDQGTTSSRAIVFDHAGDIIAMVQREFAQHFPKPGWVEHDPTEIWASQMGVAVEALSRAGVEAGQLAAIGITNQRETTLLWERATGRPIANAIVWQDRRTASMIDRIRADGGDALIRQRTGLVPDAYFSASKIAWLLDHVAGARRRAAKGEIAFGTIDTWLVHRLTGGRLHITDASNAARTMLYNIHACDWDDDLLALFDVPREVLPTVRSSSQVYAEATVESLRGVPIAGIAGDQQAALFGQMCRRHGMVKNTYGTGCFTLMHTGDNAVDSAHNLLSTIAWQREGKTEYALEGSVFIGGAVVQWLRDGLGVIREAAEVETLARRVDNSDGVVLVPAFAGLGAPHWDSYARGTMCGITRGTTAAHLARAALESIAFQVADLTDAMKNDAGLEIPELRVDGGAAANDLLMQIQADLMQTPVARPRVTETTALGAAYLAGLAVDFWRDVDELDAKWQLDRLFEPAISMDEAAARRAEWNRAVQRACGWESR